MSAFDWLNSEAFTAFGQEVIWSDMVGNTIGLIALALGWRRSIWTWPAQFLSGLILVGAYASAQLSGGVGKQLLVIGVALWGWRQWNRGKQQAQDGSIAVRFATWRERGLLLAGTAAGTLAVGLLFTAVPTLSWNPWPDAYIFVGTLAAMVAQARGLVEFWFAWLLVDIVGVPLAFSSGLAFSGLVYVIYLALVLWGMRDWWQRSRATAAALEGAPA
ncbi:nicotinamide mononucleotide transporter family protein [Streptomyces sp. CHA1]|uniref:nicotinamide mononucleotide transporter family protein n=1 Tax=unclassified Streptomyces TaxID=2593676 RepID=UPI001BFC4ACF|nr:MULTISPECIES: nicotinamide mononucleotide transporter family protein [unclassified Streptomyces]MBT3160030.1 nicotinamide mononucleotide transporter [Streptomyces sp. G11C]MCO6703992.1 nicotinamide mononucleotide transporter family protein [Streptomyces sp. CHB9.2]MCO6710284.1 nicotinamide mononucleotide transporter family protein [Streptomyces sp. CHA3]MCO6716059.1 nicotinamide mononucleotide transporter family protein [Streptomyces sp. CHB19.2]MCO6722190.1 nicotinamide mononucleotide tran